MESKNRIVRRNGYTLIELLVALFIIGLLISLLLPAIQFAREASRRMRCASHMRQIGIATANYQNTFHYFPGSKQSAAFYTQLKGFLELPAEAEYAAVFACPSDPLAKGRLRPAEVSYRVNDGTHESPPGDGFSGLLDEFLSPADFTDGLSNTASYAEHVAFPPQLERLEIDLNSSPRTQRWGMIALPDLLEPTSVLADMCVANRQSDRGVWNTSTRYNHVVTPNGPSCFTAGSLRQNEAITATSDHPSGTNLLLADGSVRFVTDTVSRSVWWALGTRAGNEATHE
jgi:prepilin-type N-terminal cleavage/methylation domain-containing protein/prepilin-type processing-associated H-X9-DG protein